MTVASSYAQPDDLTIAMIVELCDQARENNSERDHYVVVPSYRELPAIAREIIEENVDSMRSTFAKAGLNFEAWRTAKS